ncbi:MAG: PQQ-like beta-propeller repeat protein [Clostridia bacterium]|nr:PQQ-like beta-propeller repeat protein [Clostridia bacterium]
MNFKKLPISIKKTLMQGVVYGEFNNRRILYGVLAEGDCATFIIVNMESLQVERQFDLPGATGSWTLAISKDNRVYIGTYVNAGLYRYDPKKDNIEVLFTNIPGAKFIFDLNCDGENNVYGGTWPNCAVFKYNGTEERLEFVKEGIVESENYVRSLAINPEKKKIYAGIATHAHLIEIDEKIWKKQNILPEEYRDNAFCSFVGYQNDKITVIAQNQNELFMMDTVTKKVIAKKKINDINDHIPSDANAKNFAFRYDNNGLFVSDFQNNDFYFLKGEDGQSLIGGFSIGDGTKFLVTEFEGNLYIYDIKEGTREKVLIDIPKKDIEIRQIEFYKNRLYGGGYLKGGTFVYDIEHNSSIQYDGIGQSEGLIAYDDKLYIGKYPGAYIYEYDLLKEWGTDNPKELFSLKNNFNQDRPFALEIYEDKLYIGTVPNYGSTKGALTICDLKNKNFTVIENFVEDQTIVSLKAKDHVLYGGTTVCGGLGSYQVHESGTLFAYDLINGKKLYEINPVKGRKNIGGLYITEDNLILGCADTTLFIIDAKTGQKVFEQYVCVHNPEKDTKWEISFIKKGNKGLYYIVTGNRLFSFDLNSKMLYPMMKEKVNLLEIDDQGYLYMQYEDDVRHIIKSTESV